MMALIRKAFVNRATYAMIDFASISDLTTGEPVSFSGSCDKPKVMNAAEPPRFPVVIKSNSLQQFSPVGTF
jgi:hypothetical protein